MVKRLINFIRNLNNTEFEQCAEMLEIPQVVYPNDIREEKRVWKLDKDVSLLNLTFLNLIDNPNAPSFSPSHLIWKAKVPTKVKIMVWSVAHKKSTQMIWFKKEDLIWHFFQNGVLFVKMLQRTLITYFYTALLLIFCGLKLFKTSI